CPASRHAPRRCASTWPTNGCGAACRRAKSATTCPPSATGSGRGPPRPPRRRPGRSEPSLPEPPAPHLTDAAIRGSRLAMLAASPSQGRITEADAADLQQRLARTRWPDAETVDDWSQGIPLAYVREVCE